MKAHDTEESPLTYTSYLQLHPILELQQPHSNPPEHDELLFIVTHQTYELWFKVLLHELEKVTLDLSNNDLFEAVHTFKRCRTIMKTLVTQIDAIETMTPRSFHGFRKRMHSASGSQSFQFHEIEFLLGYKRSQILYNFTEDDIAFQRLQRRLEAPSLVDHFYTFLAHRGAQLPEGLENREPTAPNEPNEVVQQAIYQMYQDSNETGVLFELMLDFDEGLQEWRYRHVMMVARTLGETVGMQGSATHIEYLKESLFLSIFPDLWAIRHQF